MKPSIALLRHYAMSTVVLSLLLLACSLTIAAQIPVTNDPPFYGPYNGVFLPGGDGLKKPLVEHDTVLKADSPWSLYCWVRSDAALNGPTLLAGIGDPGEEYSRFLGLDAGKLLLWAGTANSISAPIVIKAGEWHFLAATFDGTDFHLYGDGAQVASGKLVLGRVSPVLQMAPATLPWPNGQHFGGNIAGLTLEREALSAEHIQQLFQHREDFLLVEFEEGSKPWPVQTKGQAGYRAPQDPSTWPRSAAPLSAPVARALPESKTVLQSTRDGEWTIAGGWQLTAVPKVMADGSQVATTGFETKGWLPATVPGTVLTTMVDRGVYPDPDYGLNNLAIPESLNKQDYWYRTEFKAPKSLTGRRSALTFQGINYAADIYLNGKSLGTIKGAFIRGVFDVTDILKPGLMNVLAVRVSPPPHPGIPHEQSIRGGPGENGGMMCLDGPTFVATEGWDWIPAIRDRDTGIWQPVTITASDTVRIGDPQVVTTLPLPDTSRADVEISVPLENVSGAALQGTLKAAFDTVAVSRDVTVSPGKSVVKLTPAEFTQLTVQHPRLWWPNGYGKPELYELQLTFLLNGKESDSKKIRFGIREVTYELSLLDEAGNLRRVDYSPSAARTSNLQVVDVTHLGMRQIPEPDPVPPDLPKEWREYWYSWAASIAPGAQSSAALRTVDDKKPSPYLVIKVNGVRIAARGGNWGMDDARKRVSRERLEPYFRLHRDANLNIIRNWVGQNTEEVFYDLADEYGLMVWNDFWASTQDYNVEPLDTDLFLENARDTILRFRNHPSIVMWCGRNEGVPAPNLNQGLIELTRSLDGTRYYSPSSNQVNLQRSGPYKYQDPTLYYTTLNHGFSVETGAPSLPTLESIRNWFPQPDQWPISDTWAYHDWHQSGNGDIAPFMAEIEAEFGAGANLEDFERKAQLLNYVGHRAIFEGMNAHLWDPNSGRMLWMTQPAWPSTMWQILSSDYDTQASYYGVKKACEPVHVQLDISNYEVDVINTSTAVLAGLSVVANVFSLDNKSLLHHEERRDCAANAATHGFKLDLTPLLGSTVVLVKLELRSASGQLLSDNLYWLGASSASYRALGRLPAATLTATATSQKIGDAIQVQVQLQNRGSVVSLADKLTLLNAAGSRILPAYLSDNYVSLLPGETRQIEIEYPTAAAKGQPHVAIRGWNLPALSIPIEPQK
jgi:hypothetical protein